MFVLAVFAVLFVPAAIRFDIGTDYSLIYVPEFFSDKPTEGVNRWEPGFVAICDFVQGNGLDVQWMFAISSFITYLVALLAFPHKGYHWCVFGYFVACYISSYNGVRQQIAIAFMLLAFAFQLRRKWVFAVAAAAMAPFFHSSILICLPLAFGVSLVERMNNKVLGCLFVVVSASFLIVNPIEIALDVVSCIPMFEKYVVYAMKEGQMVASGTTGLGHLLWCTVFVVQAVCLLKYRRCEACCTIAVWCLVAVVFRLASAKVTLFERFFSIACAVLPFSLAVLWHLRRDAFCRLAFYGAVAMVMLAFMRNWGFNAFVTCPEEVLPYRTIFD